MTPAIVILAYNRPEALRRLLASITAAHYPEYAEVELVISLDRADGTLGRETAKVASGFEWLHGNKRVIEHAEHLGVVGHFKADGALARQYGGVVLLEDDLTVAPPFYAFASAVLDTYAEDERVAGCSLYGLWFNGFSHEPFMPIEDGSDVFFLQLPYTQGLCFSAAQWAALEAWWRSGKVAALPGLHPAFLGFGPDEWFAALAAYLVATGRYFCFPRVSLTTGWGDAGAHFDAGTSWFQTPVQFGKRSYALAPLDEALAVYDGFYELLPDRLRRIAPALPAGDLSVDLNAAKSERDVQNDLVLTTRPVRQALGAFGLEAYPPEVNVAWQVPGNAISLARRSDVLWDRWGQAEGQRRLYRYWQRRNRPSRRRSLRHLTARAIALLRRRFGG